VHDVLHKALEVEAEVEHRVARNLAEDIGQMEWGQHKLYALFTLLAEYVTHHIRGTNFFLKSDSPKTWIWPQEFATQIDESRATWNKTKRMKLPALEFITVRASTARTKPAHHAALIEKEALMSALLDRAAAEQAVALALPLLDQARTNHVIGDSGFLHLVVLDPLRTPQNSSFEEAILYEYSVGNRNDWDADYAAFTYAKARLSWRTGLDSHIVQARYPQLLEPGDTLLWGSVCIDGIVVGASGANPWFDEALAGTVALCLRALVKGRQVAAGHEGPFLTAGAKTEPAGFDADFVVSSHGDVRRAG
jgi:hypothetical protein